ncbi:septation protein SepH [Kribbella solani]|uniref:septation protein SepH n=1 Tax=Kribbella solani TaxID=236067 RepID=UPI0029B8A627|nr:septation protein SepH [Kribbella solani]MDX3005260.1 septation protein SepH [Kribbella solani]
MREARLVGLSQDGKQLVLAMAETGEEFAVPVDDRLRAALRGDRARLGQLEIQMESALRPRDIQARIRAGESPEAVAAVAQMPMERVMAFAGPVLAERDHIANLAQRASVRRRGGGDAPTRNLGAWVTDRLRTRHIDPASAEWDAWRREDGRWAVRVSYFVESEDSDDSEAEAEAEAKDEKVAMFAYDAPGRYAVPDNDEARWLVGEQPQVVPAPVQPHPGERRLTAVADIDPALAPDHGADSYEAGFEDTIALRRRNHPPSRDTERPFTRNADDTEPGRDGSDFAREAGRDTSGFAREGARDASGFGREAGRDGSGFGREGGQDGRGFVRDAGRDDSGRDFGVEGRRDGEAGRSAGPDFGRDAGERGAGREFGRESARDGARGPRRVHSVPDPDEEPTLIDVPLDQPPAPRPSVRAVERPTDPPAFASPPEDHTSDQSPRTHHQPTRNTHLTEARPADPHTPAAHSTDRRPTDPRTSDPTQPTPRPAAPHPAEAHTSEPTRTDPRPGEPRSSEPTPRPAEARTSESTRRPAEPHASESARTASRRADARTAEAGQAGARSTDRRPADPAEPRNTEPRNTEPGSADPRDGGPRPADPRSASARSRPADPRTPESAEVDAQPTLPDGTDTSATANPPDDTPAEPKKKPARRNKRASVPSWDEIMFGKKAD